MLQLDGFNQQLLEDLSSRKWSTVASLAVLVWEYVITFTDEARHIWRRPFTGVKAAYIFARYFGIAVQVFNLYLVLGPLHRLYTPEHVCKQWFLFLIVSASTLMATLDILLMLRVYALHLKDKRVASFFVVVFLSKIALQCLIIPRIVFHVPYNPICDTTKTHPDIIYFSISTWLVHISLILLTAAKWNLVKMGAPVVRLVTRDGALTTVSICLVFPAILFYCSSSQVARAHLVFNWPISYLSILCCRLIMNMQSLEISGVEDDTINTLSTIDFDSGSLLQLGSIQTRP